MKTQSLCAAIVCACTLLSSAAVPRDFVVDLKATTADAAPYITLSWTQRLQSNISAQKIHRRLKGETVWVKLADLTTTQTSYADATAVPGVEYEYWMQRTLTSVTPSSAIGYLSAGVKVPPIETRGTLLLVIDNTMTTPLAGEITQLKADLAADGWTVKPIIVPRSTDTTTSAPGAASTKALIKAAYTEDPVNVKSVYILGYVPVPYSGNHAPDAHSPQHVGAWPADGYYGEMNSTWTDTSINNTNADDPRNDNIPGDGKFDQTNFPSTVELQVGRVDLHKMTSAPSSGVTETVLLRRYLKRAHDFRYKLGAYTNIPRRSIIRDGFGHYGSPTPIEAFAVSGFAGAFSAVGGTIDEAPSGQWFTANYASGKDYLWGYGCGGGDYSSASSVGNNVDFGYKASRVVFTSVFGSFHGDWDKDNNFMRSAIAGNANGDSIGLCCFWAGRPNWFLHPLGMGETLGYATKASMNGGFTGGYSPGGYYQTATHTGLMGDPALRMHVVEPPRKLAATSANGAVDLSWAVSTDTEVAGYHVYRAATVDGPFTRLTTDPLPTPGYTDATATAGSSYAYLVRTMKLESAPGGSYYNLSLGSSATITVNGGGTPAPNNPADLAAAAYSGPGARLTWTDSSSNETDFRIERKTGAAGTYAVITTTAPDVTQYDDPGPLAQGNVYYYRVTATSGSGDSIPSNEAAFDAKAGFAEFTQPRFRVNKNAGTASITVNRFAGGSGAATVNYASSSLTATAGTHFTTSNGTLSWADGEQGPKAITIPITNTASPQLPRQFKLTLGTPTNGLVLSTLSTTSVEIEDTLATLASPWTSTILGSITDSSPAVSAEGVIGDATVGGSGGVLDSTIENGRFIYQTRSGDGTLVMQVPTPAVNQTAARFSVMVRASTNNNAVMAATTTASSNGNYGTHFITRAAASATAVGMPVGDNNLDTTRWVRISRFGNSFLSETSADGVTWTTLGTSTLASMPPSALWGIFHFSAGNSTTTLREDFHLATYQNVSLGDLPAAAAPTGFTATPGGSAIALAWTDASFNETGFQIERQPANGVWAALQTAAANAVSFNDATSLAGVYYNYRIKASSAAGDSAWVNAAATAPGTATGYRLWLQANGLPMDETGTGSATATPSNDALPNLMKYALGLSSVDRGHQGRLASALTTDGDVSQFTFSYTRPEPAPADIGYSVEGSADLNGSGWSTNGISNVSIVPNGNVATVTVRQDTPAAGDGKYFMRLKVSQQ